MKEWCGIISMQTRIISEKLYAASTLSHNFFQLSLKSGFAQVQTLPAEIPDCEDVLQWSRLEVRLNAFRRSTIP